MPERLPELDVGFVRAQFPAFAEPGLAGQAFFESAGGSYCCGQVIDRLTRYYRSRKVQPYSHYAASQDAGDEMDESRARMAAMLGVQADEVSFGPSTSQNTYVLAQAFRSMLQPGDAIVVTDQDHEANSGVWRRLADCGFEVRPWSVDPDTGHLDPAKLGELLDARARLVCFPHCSNIVGEINPVRQITTMIHDAGAISCVDGVSYAPHGFPNVAALGADIYLLSAYKTYGPHQGIMVVRNALAQRLPNQGHYFNAGDPTKRLTPAGPDHAQIAASAGMADYVDALHAHHFSKTSVPAERAARVGELQRSHERQLLAPLLDYLRGRNDIRLIGPEQPQGRVPTVSMLLDQPGAQAACDLAANGIMAGGGDFYAVRLLEALGIDPGHGVLRLSFVHYTEPGEIDRLIAALNDVL
jgi:selenocysteine lyase/cysteine desulfurase